MSDKSALIITSDQYVGDPVPPWPLTPDQERDLLAATADTITAGMPADRVPHEAVEAPCNTPPAQDHKETR